MTYRLISEDEFADHFRPIPVDGDGNVWREHDRTLEFPEEQVWSIVEPGGPALIAIPGYPW